MEQLPSAHRVASWGTRPANRIALTFDDGPDNRIPLEYSMSCMKKV